jgi:hypothetical protein
MAPWNDVEVSVILAGMLIGIIAVFLSIEDKSALLNRGGLTRLGGGLLLGLLTGYLAVQITQPLEGCSVIKAKDSNFYLVWGTDGVTVRTVVICAIVGTVLGTLSQWVRSRHPRGDTKTNITSTVAVKQEHSTPSSNGKHWNAAVVGGVLGLLSGAFLIGLPAAFILDILRTLRGLR